MARVTNRNLLRDCPLKRSSNFESNGSNIIEKIQQATWNPKTVNIADCSHSNLVVQNKQDFLEKTCRGFEFHSKKHKRTRGILIAQKKETIKV